MLLVDERLVCTCHECGAEFVVKKSPGLEKQSMRCACGCELKKAYHPPVLTVFGTASEIDRLNLHLGETLARLENLKRLRHSTEK